MVVRLAALRTGRFYPQEILLVLIQMKPSGVEPVAFRFVAQYLNHCTTAIPGF